MKRNANLDLMRLFLCLGVICIHSLGYFGIENSRLFTSINMFLLQANGIFYIVSGYFNLEKEFKDSKDIKQYYKNKFINIFLPFLAFTFVWAIWDYFHNYEVFNITDFFWDYYSSLLCDYSSTHMWFLYPYFGLLLSTPFLSKMLHNMDKKELKILWYIAIVWNVVSLYLGDDLRIDFRYQNWILTTWTIYYFVGYYYRHVLVNESKVKWLVLGVLGYAVTIYCEFNIYPFVASAEYQIMFVLFCTGIFSFWDRVINVKNEKVIKVIGFLSKNTFFIYLFHLRAIEYVLRKLAIVEGSLINGIILVILSFIVSLLLSIVARLCLKPLQKLIDKVWRVA